MLVRDAMVKDVISAERDEKLAKALKKMKEHGVHQIPVVAGTDVVGMLFLKDAIRFTKDAESEIVEKIMKKMPSLGTEDDLEKAVETISKLGVRSIAVDEKGKLAGVISETDLIKHAQLIEEISPYKMRSASVFTVKTNDGLGKAVSIMSEHNVSRVPVVDEKDSIVGCVDDLSLIDLVTAQAESVRAANFTAVEKASAKDFPVEKYMRKTVAMDVGQFSLKKAIEILQNHEEIVITENGGPIGIVTPKDLLELAVVHEGTPIVVSHLEKIDPFEKGRLEQTIESFVDKIGKMMKADRLFIYVDVHDVGGSKKKYSLRSSFLANGSTFRAKSHGWTVMEATHALIEKLEKQLMKYDEQEKKHKGERKKELLKEKLARKESE